MLDYRPPSDETVNDHNHCDDKKNVDQAPADWKYKRSNQPQN